MIEAAAQRRAEAAAVRCDGDGSNSRARSGITPVIRHEALATLT
jgi:predicted lipoprotein